MSTKTSDSSVAYLIARGPFMAIARETITAPIDIVVVTGTFAAYVHILLSMNVQAAHYLIWIGLTIPLGALYYYYIISLRRRLAKWCATKALAFMLSLLTTANQWVPYAPYWSRISIVCGVFSVAAATAIGSFAGIFRDSDALTMGARVAGILMIMGAGALFYMAVVMYRRLIVWTVDAGAHLAFFLSTVAPLEVAATVGRRLSASRLSTTVVVFGAGLIGAWALGGVAYDARIRRAASLGSPLLSDLRSRSLKRARESRNNRFIVSVILAWVWFRVVRNSRSMKQVEIVRDYYLLRACVLCDQGAYDEVVTVVNEGQTRLEDLAAKPSDALRSVRLQALIRMGHREQAAEVEREVAILVKRDTNNGYWLFNRAYLRWQRGDLDGAILDAREVVQRRDVAPAQLIVAGRVLAQVLCEKVLQSQEISVESRMKVLNEARTTIRDCWHRVEQQRIYYGPLLSTAGVFDWCRGDYKLGTRKFLVGVARTNDRPSHFHLGVVAMIGSRTFVRAEYELNYVLRVLSDFPDSRLYRQVLMCRDRMLGARAKQKVFGRELLRYYRWSGDLPDDAFVSGDQMQAEREFREELLTVRIGELWSVARTMVRPPAGRSEARVFEAAYAQR